MSSIKNPKAGQIDFAKAVEATIQDFDMLFPADGIDAMVLTEKEFQMMNEDRLDEVVASLHRRKAVQARRLAIKQK